MKRLFSLGIILLLFSAFMMAGCSIGDEKKPVVSYYLYVTSKTSNTVTAYSIGSNGAIALIDSISTGPSPSAIAVDPTGKHVYVGASSNITSFSIGSNGALTAINAALLGNATAIDIDPSGKYVYVTDDVYDKIYTFNLRADGGFTGTSANSSLDTGSDPSAITVDSTGKHLYVGNPNTVISYSIGANSALTAINAALVGNATGIAVEPSCKYVYAADYEYSQILAFTLRADGGFSGVTANSSLNSGPNPRAIAVHPGGKYVYLGTATNVTAYSIGSNGALGAINAGLAANAVSVAVHPNRKYVYAANYNDDSISGFNIGVNGGLTSFGTYPVCNDPSAIAIARVITSN
ncbi:MAG TPA: beta-propeller fold lactonase family protein [Bacillota bacterium]|nr:beta-propeller fold lactonase family protein [Bacillota bacterium]